MEKAVSTTKPKHTVIKTGIKAITDYLIGRITSLGYDIYISYSGVSRSRYMEIMLSKSKKIFVRISDHPAESTRRRLCTFDIYTDEWRPGSVSYFVFLKTFRTIMRNPENEQNRSKFTRVYDYDKKFDEKNNRFTA